MIIKLKCRLLVIIINFQNKALLKLIHSHYLIPKQIMVNSKKKKLIILNHHFYQKIINPQSNKQLLIYKIKFMRIVININQIHLIKKHYLIHMYQIILVLLIPKKLIQISTIKPYLKKCFLKSTKDSYNLVSIYEIPNSTKLVFTLDCELRISK